MIQRWLRQVIPAPEVHVLSQGSKDEEIHASEVYHDAARHFLDVQLSTMDALGGKTAHYLTVASVLLPIVTTLLVVVAGDPGSVPWYSRGLLLASLIAYIAVLVCSGASGLISAFEYRPNIAFLKEYSEAYVGAELRQWVANEYLASIDQNRAVLIRKARWVGAEAVAFFLEGFFLATAVAATLLL